MKTTLPICITNMTAMLARVGILIMATAFLAGCGSKISGIYKPDAKGSMLLKQLNFTSGSKVELTRTMTGAITEASYVVEGDKVKISAAGQTSIFTIDKNGCLDGGQVVGKFCKQ